MTEKLLQYIWQFQYFNRDNLITTTGESIRISHQGQLNNNQGPDFLQARISIGSTTLAGSIELHLKTSDWQRHKHSLDENYNNVILHVVYQNDDQVQDPALPVLELNYRICRLLLDRYDQLMQATPTFVCYPSISRVKELTWSSWKERLVAERLTRKADKIFVLLQRNNFHWEETFWWMLARSFGGTVNADAFEELAQSISINILWKHKTQISQIEAIVFGQGNLLNKDLKDEYAKQLQQEYKFLKNKFGLQPIHAALLFMRMRPAGFPTLRLAQLAMLTHSTDRLFETVLHSANCSDIQRLFSVTTTDYWHNHYLFDEPSAPKLKKSGSSMINHVMINLVIPMLFAYGQYNKEERYKLKALQWLENVQAETNQITAGFISASLKNKNAFDSQAYIELKTQYCDQKNCLHCAIGYSLLRGI